MNNYLGLTTGGMTVDCPHRERRGYGGDGHTSYQFALAHFGVGAYFTKWARDFADVQTADGNVPHSADGERRRRARVVGLVITLPYEVHRAHGDTRLLPKCTRRCSGCSPSPTTPTRPTTCCTRGRHPSGTFWAIGSCRPARRTTRTARPNHSSTTPTSATSPDAPPPSRAPSGGRRRRRRRSTRRRRASTLASTPRTPMPPRAGTSTRSRPTWCYRSRRAPSPPRCGRRRSRSSSTPSSSAPRATSTPGSRAPTF